ANRLPRGAATYGRNRQAPVHHELLHRKRPGRTASVSRVVMPQGRWEGAIHLIHVTAGFSLPCRHERHGQEGERKNPEDQRVEACLAPLLLGLIVWADVLRLV